MREQERGRDTLYRVSCLIRPPLHPAKSARIAGMHLPCVCGLTQKLILIFQMTSSVAEQRSLLLGLQPGLHCTILTSLFMPFSGDSKCAMPRGKADQKQKFVTNKVTEVG